MKFHLFYRKADDLIGDLFYLNSAGLWCFPDRNGENQAAGHLNGGNSSRRAVPGMQEQKEKYRQWSDLQSIREELFPDLQLFIKDVRFVLSSVICRSGGTNEVRA